MESVKVTLLHIGTTHLFSVTMNNERYLPRLVDPIVDETLAICGAVYHDGAHVGLRPEFGAVKMQFANQQKTIWKNSRSIVCIFC